MIYGRKVSSKTNKFYLITSRKTQPLLKSRIICSHHTKNTKSSPIFDFEGSKTEQKSQLTLRSLSDLTKFRLSQYNTLAAYSTYLYFAPSFMPFESMLFLCATQLISMSSQAYNQVAEAEYDSKMRRTQNRPVARKVISKRTGGLISAGLAIGSFGVYMQLANPGALLVANSIWIGY